ncbi:hypothetical protein P9314_05145 [Paenibacillus validus]|uniref:hypothetical protein n=1 Tax=Paenibacillus validus TaxID=44253 RepID=UPI0013E0DAFA|nr:hypothetical protein [Paenibacillus validus]MED4600095.1 hypothetical protein [Paenibacillus validus]MED4605543.1 hypothetical protein [Paenibacillus validus]
MSEDLKNYLFEQLEEHISDLEDEFQQENNENKIMYHMDKIKDITGKLKVAVISA